MFVAEESHPGTRFVRGSPVVVRHARNLLLTADLVDAVSRGHRSVRPYPVLDTVQRGDVVWSAEYADAPSLVQWGRLPAAAIALEQDARKQSQPPPTATGSGGWAARRPKPPLG